MKFGVVEGIVLGMVSTDTWLLKHKETGEMLIIDPADRADIIARQVKKMEGIPKGVLLTHGHFDHMMAAEDLRNQYQIPIYALEGEKGLLSNARTNLSESWAKACTLEADYWLKDNERIHAAGFDIQVLHTPGHTSGSCCYYIKEEELLFSGDTLFAGSVGRTDFQTSNPHQMKTSLQRLLTQLPGETVVCPGHGEQTTIAYEKRYNPFA